MAQADDWYMAADMGQNAGDDPVLLVHIRLGEAGVVPEEDDLASAPRQSDREHDRVPRHGGADPGRDQDADCGPIDCLRHAQHVGAPQVPKEHICRLREPALGVVHSIARRVAPQQAVETATQPVHLELQERVAERSASKDSHLLTPEARVPLAEPTTTRGTRKPSGPNRTSAGQPRDRRRGRTRGRPGATDAGRTRPKGREGARAMLRPCDRVQATCRRWP